MLRGPLDALSYLVINAAPFMGLIGLLLGLVSYLAIRKGEQEPGYKTVAIVAIILGLIDFLYYLLGAFLFLRALLG